jgi:hypothetical protein
VSDKLFAWLKTLELGSQVYIWTPYSHIDNYYGYITKIGYKYIYVGKSKEFNEVMDAVFDIKTGEHKTEYLRFTIWKSEEECKADRERRNFASELYRNLREGTFHQLPLEELQQIAKIVGYKQEGR